jgi:16S rRNA (cytosine967-C5)-methyltransferase
LKSAATARDIAARVIERVDRDQAFAAAALDAELASHPQLDPRERALATELVYGCLRTRGAVEQRLLKFAPRGLPKNRLVVSHLLVAAYQLLVLERVPDFAVVDAAVRAIAEARDQKLAGFANAVLRKLAGSGERLALADAVVESAPAWLLDRLSRVVGRDDAIALLGAGGGAPPVSVRLIAGAAVPDWLEEAERGRLSPRARQVRSGGNLRRRPGHAEGAYVQQEEGAQFVALALGARAGERVLDACAGRGQKASLLAEQVGASGELWAADQHPQKLDVLKSEFARLRLSGPCTAAVDWTVGSGSIPEGFDRALVDAPCTGIGTLRRRPEIARRLTPEDPARLGELQARILRSVATRVRPGGRLVYAVCSVLPDECESVVERVLDVLEPAAFDAPEVEVLSLGEQTTFRLLPLRHGTDGYFAASFVRR